MARSLTGIVTLNARADDKLDVVKSIEREGVVEWCQSGRVDVRGWLSGIHHHFLVFQITEWVFFPNLDTYYIMDTSSLS